MFGRDSIPRDKLFSERERLCLVVRLQSRTIDDLRCFRSALQAEFAEELSVLDEKRHIVWADLKYGFGTTLFSVSIAKARIKKARIMGA
jgi:hypothetical protein